MLKILFLVYQKYNKLKLGTLWKTTAMKSTNVFVTEKLDNNYRHINIWSNIVPNSRNNCYIDNIYPK